MRDKRVRMLGNGRSAKYEQTAPRTWQPVPFSVFVADDGRRYPTVAHAYHAAKMRASGRNKRALLFAVQPGTDRVAVGWHVPRHVRHHMTRGQRAAWNARKVDVLMALMHARITQDDCLREVLLSTGDMQLPMTQMETIRARLRV